MGKKSKAPPAPDYKAAAEATAAANRPTQVTPWGRTDWSQDPAGKWTENVSLNPAEQAQLESQRGTQAAFDKTATGLLGQVDQNMSTPLDFSGLDNPDAGFGAVQEVQDAMMSRLQPGRDQMREKELQRLHNQGLSDNTEAFQRGLTRLDQGDTDASQQALLAAMSASGDLFNRGMGKRQQGITEANMLRQSPLNDLLKLQGQDVSSPSMPSFMAGPDYTGAARDSYKSAMDAYNAKQARGNGLMSGLFGLGASALGGPAGGIGSRLATKFLGI